MAGDSWTRFFSELSSFLHSCERQYGFANQQYTEYVIEHMSMSCQSVQALIDHIRRAETTDLSGILSNLMQLKDNLHYFLQLWRNYSDTLDLQRAQSGYVTPTLVSGRGRPRFQINKNQLQYLRSLSFSWTAIADLLMVSRMTVYRRRVDYGLLDESHCSISDQELIEIVQQTLAQHPQVGQSFIAGRLRSLGYKVTRERVRHAVHICDPLDAALKWQGIVTRRHPYSVPGPNSLWHIGTYFIM